MTRHKCLLIQPTIKSTDPPYNIPLGLIQIAGVIEKEGHDVALFDNNVHKVTHNEIIDEIKDESWDVIGLGNLITTYHWQKDMFKELRKEFPNTLLIDGGGLATSVKDKLLDYIPEMDMTCIGEGERTITQILDNLDGRAWENVKGIYYRDKDKIIWNGYQDPLTEEELSNLPYPKYDLLPLDEYFKYSNIPLSPDTLLCKRRLSIEASRGCPFGCSFCIDLYRGRPRMANKTPTRYKSPEYVVGLMKHLRTKYALDMISFADEEFTINRKYVMEFCNLIEKEGLNDLDPPLLWGTNAHVTTLDNEILERLRSAGCCYLDLGMESMNDSILKYDIGKGSSAEKNIDAFNMCLKANVYPITNFIIGFPRESMQSVYDTTKFLKDNSIECGPFFATPYPSTGLFERCKDRIMNKFGTLENFIIKCKDDISKEFVVNLTEYNDAELLGIRNMIINHDIEEILEFAKYKGENVDVDNS